MQDTWDWWENSMILKGVNNGGIIGFKYFGFEGLKKDTKGVKAFEGTRKGNGTQIVVNLTPTTDKPFKLHVMMDSPWKDGQEIGVLSNTGHNGENVALKADVSKYVDGIKGKHAIYLVADGPEIEQPRMDPRFAQRAGARPMRPRGLFDLQGIGFSSKDSKVERPIAPTVQIKVDGKDLVMPTEPIRSTNLNGYTDVTRYQVYGPVTDGSKIEVISTNPAVKVSVSKIVEGRATVKCTYNGLDKVYLIN